MQDATTAPGDVYDCSKTDSSEVTRTYSVIGCRRAQSGLQTVPCYLLLRITHPVVGLVRVSVNVEVNVNQKFLAWLK